MKCTSLCEVGGKLIWRAFAFSVSSSKGFPYTTESIFIDQKGWLVKLICESSADCEILIYRSRKVYEEHTPITRQVLDRMAGRDNMMEEMFHHAYGPGGQILEIAQLCLSTPLELRPNFPNGPGELKVVAYVKD